MIFDILCVHMFNGSLTYSSFQLPHVSHIIFFEDPLRGAKEAATLLDGNVEVVPFREIVTKVSISLDDLKNKKGQSITHKIQCLNIGRQYTCIKVQR